MNEETQAAMDDYAGDEHAFIEELQWAVDHVEEFGMDAVDWFSGYLEDLAVDEGKPRSWVDEVDWIAVAKDVIKNTIKEGKAKDFDWDSIIS